MQAGDPLSTQAAATSLPTLLDLPRELLVEIPAKLRTKNKCRLMCTSKVLWSLLRRSGRVWNRVELAPATQVKAEQQSLWLKQRRRLIYKLCLRGAAVSDAAHMLGTLAGGPLKKLYWTVGDSVLQGARVGSLFFLDFSGLRLLSLRCTQDWEELEQDSQGACCALTPAFTQLTALTKLHESGFPRLLWEPGCLPPALEQLTVESCDISVDSPSHAAVMEMVVLAASGATALQSLTLTCHPLQEELGLVPFGLLASQLTNLKLEGDCLLPSLVPLAALTGLCRLELELGWVPEEQAEWGDVPLGPLTALQCLTWLALHVWEHAELSAAALDPLWRMPSLRVLDLGNTPAPAPLPSAEQQQHQQRQQEQQQLRQEHNAADCAPSSPQPAASSRIRALTVSLPAAGRLADQIASMSHLADLTVTVESWHPPITHAVCALLFRDGPSAVSGAACRSAASRRRQLKCVLPEGVVLPEDLQQSFQKLDEAYPGLQVTWEQQR